jgi:hypothetical protein
MIRFYITVLCCLLSPLVYGGPFAHFLNPITKQATRLDFGSLTVQTLIDGQHWVTQGPVKIDSLSLLEIRKDTEFKTVATSSPNQFTLFQECTNQVFNFNLTTRLITRLDRTYFKGDNCGSHVFMRDGKYHQVGGYGFWEGNNHITYFDPTLKEWEGISVSGDVPLSIYRGYCAYLPEDDKLITLSNFTNDISRDFGSLNHVNSIYEFSFKSREWTNIGDVTHPYLRDVLDKIPINHRERTIFTGKYFVLFPMGNAGRVTIVFIDPRTLAIYEFQDADMKFARFPVFNMSIANPNTFHHNEWLLGTVHSNTAHLTNVSQLINLHEIAQKAKFIGYLTDKPWYRNNWFYAALALLLMSSAYALVRRYTRKSQHAKLDMLTNTPKVGSHFGELQCQLLSQLYHHSTQEGLDVVQVNEILGINQLGADTQRFRRSTVIKELNSKLTILTGEKNAILRVSSQLDKRQKRYMLQDQVKDFVKKELSL